MWSEVSQKGVEHSNTLCRISSSDMICLCSSGVASNVRIWWRYNGKGRREGGVTGGGGIRGEEGGVRGRRGGGREE